MSLSDWRLLTPDTSCLQRETRFEERVPDSRYISNPNLISLLERVRVFVIALGET